MPVFLRSSLQVGVWVCGGGGGCLLGGSLPGSHVGRRRHSVVLIKCKLGQEWFNFI